MFLALNEIRKNKKKFILIISIVVLISYLVFFLLGLAYGLAKDNRTTVDLWKAENVVLSEGSNSSLYSSTIDYEEIEKFNKNIASPINVSRGDFYLNKDREYIINTSIIGIDYNSKIAPKIIEGKMPRNMYDILASIDLKIEDGVKIGDTLKATQNDTKYKVCGFTESAKFNVASSIYTNLYVSSIDRKFNQSVKLENIKDINKKPKKINGIILSKDYKGKLRDGLDIITIKEFINAIPGYLPQVVTFSLMIGFLVFISAIVLGVFLYIITMQKKMTFGIMKIQGISNNYISKSVLVETFILVFIGVVIGMILTYLTALGLPISIPFKSNFLFFVVIGLFMIVTSLIGGIFSVISVSRVDPLEALE